MLSLNDRNSDFKYLDSTIDQGIKDIRVAGSTSHSIPNWEIWGPLAYDQAIETYLLTKKGERLFHIYFGSTLTNYLFRKSSEIDDSIKGDVFNDLEKALSIYIDRESSTISATPEDPHKIVMRIRYACNDPVIAPRWLSTVFSI